MDERIKSNHISERKYISTRELEIFLNTHCDPNDFISRTAINLLKQASQECEGYHIHHIHSESFTHQSFWDSDPNETEEATFDIALKQMKPFFWELSSKRAEKIGDMCKYRVDLLIATREEP